jgi:membrane peptidoglycan carboxypeptidase
MTPSGSHDGSGPPSGGGGATGIFPPVGGYQSGQPVAPPRGYVPPPGPGRRRPPPPPPKKRFIDYPRSARTGFTRWLPSWKLVAAIFGTGFVLVFVLIAYAYSATSIPPPDQSVQAQTTIIYYSNGAELGRLATQNRQNVQLAQVPLPVRQAVLAAEDHTFYTNSGVDPMSIGRAIWSNVRGNSLQGGSTISQQYVKNVYNQRDRTFKRKFKEVFLAVKINRQVNKDQILERYLNTIYLGRGAYGIQAASQAYFGKDVGKLTVSQGAFLAGIINAPSLADPRGGTDQKERAERRWGVVLDAMVKDQILTPEERAKQKFPTTIVPRKAASLKGQNGYLMTMAESEAAKDLNISEDQIETGGYKITTTFDKRLVDAGVAAVKNGLPSKLPKGLHIGMTSVDPKTGAIRAIYGGTDYLKRNRNAATQDTAEAGSTFKPFALIAALSDGVSLNNEYSSSSPMKIAGTKVKNFGGEHFGYINLIKATEESVNTVYVQLNHQIGPDKTQAAAYAAGIPKTANVQQNLVNVLGSANPHPVDMASAYATFANRGVRHDPYSVQTISDVGTGAVRWKIPNNKGKQVFDADAVSDLTFAMQKVVQGGTGAYARQLNRPVAGKTGTSSDSRSAWFVGFTPQLSTAVAMYQIGPNGSVVAMKGFGAFRSVTGGGYPVQIWTKYMADALDGKPVVDFPDPQYVGDVTNTSPPTVAPTQNTQPTTNPNPTVTTNPTPTSVPTTPTEPTRTTIPTVTATAIPTKTRGR